MLLMKFKTDKALGIKKRGWPKGKKRGPRSPIPKVLRAVSIQNTDFLKIAMMHEMLSTKTKNAIWKELAYAR